MYTRFIIGCTLYLPSNTGNTPTWILRFVFAPLLEYNRQDEHPSLRHLGLTTRQTPSAAG